jgi:ATPase subunit of ABC transporter with duplicated ATPase domains
MGTQASTAIGRRPVLLLVTGLGKSYRRPVLREVGLQAHPGQVVAITGENGSGKTALLRICAGRQTADTGTARRCPCRQLRLTPAREHSTAMY